MKYAPRKVYIKENGGYTELSYIRRELVHFRRELRIYSPKKAAKP